ncbi:hypothetical protein UB32_10470 [Mesobacillus subterraneus]|uniref:Uncharacterized protein n=1 Tax=Mesobacillus subterraneus TaxID=285983 RepID=A0A0D6Z946_9BACI|nr:hypothetical protein UB32_10470 [Mesobacillus subterraneus]
MTQILFPLKAKISVTSDAPLPYKYPRPYIAAFIIDKGIGRITEANSLTMLVKMSKLVYDRQRGN